MDSRELPTATVVVPPTASGGYDASAAHATGAQVVMGVVVDNEESAFLVRRVLRISLVLAVMAVVSVFMNLSTGSALVVIAQLIVVSIPACGYYGAKNRSKDLLQWFWLSNACCVCLGVVSLVLSLGVSLPMVDCYCDPICRADTLHISNSTSANLSPAERSQLEQLDQVCANESEFHRALYIGAGLTLLQMALQCAACIYGRQLADTSIGFSGGAGQGAIGSFSQLQQPVAVPVVPPQPSGDLEMAQRGADEDRLGPIQRGTVVRMPTT